MRKISLILNLVATICFGAFLACTFVARPHVDGLARRYVTEKTISYSRPVVELASRSLDSPTVQKLVSADQRAILRHEIAEFHNDAGQYVSDLTRGKRLPVEIDPLNPLVARAAAIKERIREFYDVTLTALIKDLRIFSASNLVAASVALWLVLRSGNTVSKALIGLSLLMFAAVVVSSLVYVDSLTFFRILFRQEMGWGYPFALSIVLSVFCWMHESAASQKVSLRPVRT